MKLKYEKWTLLNNQTREFCFPWTVRATLGNRLTYTHTKNDEHFEIILINTSKANAFVYSSIDAHRTYRQIHPIPSSSLWSAVFLFFLSFIGIHYCQFSLASQMHFTNRFHFIPYTDFDEY